MSRLGGKNVALTGRLASMSREEAAQLIRESGGEYVTSVDEHTSILVVGRDGFPLAEDGRLSRNLRVAKKLRAEAGTPEILPEEDFLRRTGQEQKEEAIHHLYSTAQLSRILGVAEQKIRAWMRKGLIAPVQKDKRLYYFDFQQVSVAKVVSELTRSGVTPSRLRSSLKQLDGWLPGAAAGSLQQLQLLERDGQLLVRLDDGHLAEPTGQLQFDFATEAEAKPVSAPPPQSGGPVTALPKVRDFFEEGVEHEEEEQWAQARIAYERALENSEPTPEICYNLGNVLYNLELYQEAVDHLRDAVRMDPQFVEAWSNLGIVLSELGDLEPAAEALRHALRLAPLYADAHYNLAEILDQLGRRDEADRHWQSYLDQDPHSSWAREVKRRLRQPRSG